MAREGLHIPPSSVLLAGQNARVNEAFRLLGWGLQLNEIQHVEALESTKTIKECAVGLEK